MAYSLPGYNNTVTCPYNKSHNIMRERLQTHLIKCARSYPQVVLSKCPFNSSHLLRESDMEEHVKICENRASLDLFKYTLSNKPLDREHQDEKPRIAPAVQSSENWDDEDHPTYDPQAYVENAPVIRTLNLATPSERRAFREQERLRLNQLERK